MVAGGVRRAENGAGAGRGGRSGERRGRRESVRHLVIIKRESRQ